MSAQIVLDTDVVIHLLRKNTAYMSAFIRLHENNTRFIITPVVVAEIYAGAFAKEYGDIETFFALCQKSSTDCPTGQLAGQYAQQYRKAFQGISMEDFLLAATAKALRCPLWTCNAKHYPMDDIVLFVP
jgi:predicted nucleic acid-binding protein